jgi:hypothetical protein
VLDVTTMGMTVAVLVGSGVIGGGLLGGWLVLGALIAEAVSRGRGGNG